MHRPITKSTEQQKIDWVNSKLDQEEERLDSLYISRNRATTKDDKTVTQLFDPVERAIMSAWRGDIEPLKKLYPKLVPFLVARKRLKTKGPRIDLLTLAANDVKFIRDLWRAHPDKRIYRATADVEIAIARWDDKSDQYRSEVTVPAVVKKLKPSGPSGKKRPKE
jgi:hypothetical protein